MPYELSHDSIARQVYEAHLSLTNHTYQLFKQFGDAMLIGDRDRGAGKTELQSKIRGDIARIRRLTAEEIQIAGEEEIEELEHLDRIKTKIDDLLVEYQAFVRSPNRDELSTYWTRLSFLLDETVDKDFNQLIQEAIAGEAEEVAEEREAAAAMIQRFQALAAIFTMIAVLAAAVSIWILRRDLREPIIKLVGGASALAQGDLEHRIDVVGRNELDDVSRSFNKMADEVASREKALQNSNKRLEQAVSDRTAELERLLDALKESDSNRRRLLADVSHELRTPLTIIRGEADIALRGQDGSTEQYRDVLARIRDASIHTSDLVDDLLFVARREAGEARLKLDPVNLCALLPKVVEQHGAIATQLKAAVTFSTDVDEAIVRADAGRIRQVVIILLENAIRYGGSAIELRLDPSPGGFAISVCDDGPGMSEEEQVRAFDRFFRGSNAAARYDQGAGLGLPMAKAIVEAHGGKIALTSPPGEGVTVSFTLPERAKLEVVA